MGSTQKSKELAVAFARKEMTRYGESDGLRSRLATVISASGAVISALPGVTLENVSSNSDPDTFNGCLGRFGLSDSEIRSYIEIEDQFLTSISAWRSIERLTFCVCKDYHRCSQGLETKVGRDEAVTLFPMQHAVRGSHYEGWSEVAGRESIRDCGPRQTLAYSTVPYPPGIGIVTGGERRSELSGSHSGARVRLGSEQMITEWILELRLIAVLSFDNDGLLFFVPRNSYSDSTQSIAAECGMTIL